MTTIYQKNISICPVNATTKISTNDSDKYKFLSSNNIKSFFEDQGFTLDGVSQANVRTAEKQGYQKHLMLFSRPDLLIDSDNKLQLLVTNSHDATSSLKLNLGVYRAICANGLVSGDDIYQQTIRHIGKNIIEQTKESLYYILGHMQQLKKEVESMRNRPVTFSESQEFLKNAADLRLKDVDVEAVQLNTIDKIRRNGDSGQDLWSFFNRVQESVIRGGIKYTKKVDIIDQNGNKIQTIKNGTTRNITNISKSLELNKGLWNNAIKLVA